MANQHRLHPFMPAPGSGKSAATGRRPVDDDFLRAWKNEYRARRALQKPRKSRPAKPRAKPARDRYAYMRGAARRFRGLSEELEWRMEMRNISCKEDGFLVQFLRVGKRFSRWFAGLSDESLFAAIDFRDEAERIFGGSLRNAVPPHILSLLGLPAPVRGIHRDPRDLSYGVVYNDAQQKPRSRNFCFKHVPEEDAYASAIAFLEQTVAAERVKRTR